MCQFYGFQLFHKMTKTKHLKQAQVIQKTAKNEFKILSFIHHFKIIYKLNQRKKGNMHN